MLNVWQGVPFRPNVASIQLRGARTVKDFCRRVVAWTLDASGLLKLWQTLALRDAAVVLMYHRVLPLEDRRCTGSHPAIVVDSGTFAMHMAVLRKRFNVLSMGEFCRMMERRQAFPKGACVITFDDGWRDNLTHAWPVLRTHALPATIFLPVRFIGADRSFWRESLTHALVSAIHRCREQPALASRCATLLEPLGLSSLLRTESDDPIEDVRAALADMKHATPKAVEGLIDVMTSELGVLASATSSTDAFLDWEQVTALADEGVTFGGHGAAHHLLTDVPLEAADADIKESKAVLAAKVPQAAPAFAYPNGNWNAEVAALVGAAGFRFAFTTDPGVVRCNDNPLTLRRVNIHEAATSTPSLFMARVLGVL